MNPHNKIMLSQQESIIFVKHEDILYCQSDSCYTKIFLVNKKHILIVKSLIKFHKVLPRHFVRVNQSFIVNKLFVERIDKKKKTIQLEGNHNIPFSTTLKELLSLLNGDSFEDKGLDAI